MILLLLILILSSVLFVQFVKSEKADINDLCIIVECERGVMIKCCPIPEIPICECVDEKPICKCFSE